ncbi:polymorphic toxin type 15 domain-containing protein [Vibrio parahaemolyticus]
MGKPAAVIGSMHVCPKVTAKVPHVGGPVVGGSPNVKIGGHPAARKGDKLVCVGPPDTVSEGSSSVFINGKPAARMGDGTAHGGKIVIGNPTVTIGDGGATTKKSKAAKVEVPEFDLDKVLANPELEAIRAVNIDPASMLVDDIDSLFKEGQEFINNPTLAGAVAMAVTAIPGKFSDEIVDELPLKKLDRAMAKSLRTMKRFKVPCFKPGSKLKNSFKGRERELESHFARQLKHQENGLNDLTVGEYIENRTRYKEIKRAGTGMAQEDFRKIFSDELKESLNDSYLDRMTANEAKKEAESRSAEIMENLAALHDPDMIAGGKDNVSRMGDKGVNSSLGSQWRSQSRLAQMDAQAQKALETLGPDAKMNVSLERCPLQGKK